MTIDKKSLRIVYMGTPEFAVEPLRCLVEGGYNVVGVVTGPDKPIGRHQETLQPTAVKVYAESVGLPILTPEKLRDEQFHTDLRSWNADLQIIVAFRMLPESIWSMPRLGTFNLHASLLPQYRGAAPINWAIINGDTETGVTTFFLQHDIDTGNIIEQAHLPIADTDNVGIVYDNLMHLGGKVVCSTVDRILAGNLDAVPQAQMATNEPLRPAPKIFKETCRIDWSKGVKRCYDFIRGLSPYPAAWTELLIDNKAQVLKIYDAIKEMATPSSPLGTVIIDGKSLKIALSDGYLHLTEIQLAGKKRMPTKQFLNGFKAGKSMKIC